jgi:DnaK suppressor protein
MAGDTYKGFASYQTEAGEEYMNEKQKEHFRAILLGWKRELMEESERTVNHMQSEHLHLPDPADRASQEEEFSLELRARDRERKLIRKIDKSLKRLADDEYGYCENCGIEIGIQRLEARPTAELCIDCKQLEEKKEKNRAA